MKWISFEISPLSRRTMCPEGDFLEKIKFIENRTIYKSQVDPIYAEFHEESLKIHFKTVK